MKELVARNRFFRFFGISTIGTVIDYLSAIALYSLLGLSGVVASTLGCLLGTAVNYLGHHHITVANPDSGAATILGFLKYLGAVLASLAVRLAVLVILQGSTSLPFWLILSVAFAGSFLCSYAISLFWVFRRKT